MSREKAIKILKAHRGLSNMVQTGRLLSPEFTEYKKAHGEGGVLNWLRDKAIELLESESKQGEFTKAFRGQLEKNKNNYIQGRTIDMGFEACDRIDSLEAELGMLKMGFKPAKLEAGEFMKEMKHQLYHAPCKDTSLNAVKVAEKCLERIDKLESVIENYRDILKTDREVIKQLQTENKDKAKIAQFKRGCLNVKIVLLQAELKAKEEAHKKEIFKLNDACVKMRKAKDEKIEAQEDILHKIKNWCKAYPRDVFPQPDKEYFKKAHIILKENGLSLTRISADNIRHVVEGIQKLIDEGVEDEEIQS